MRKSFQKFSALFMILLMVGSFILHPGDVMKADGSLNSEYNINGYAKHSVIKEAALLTGRDVVNVKLIDIPTGNIIFNKDVYVVESDKEFF